MKTSKQKCIEHAQATLGRLRELTFGCEVELKAYHGSWMKHKVRQESETLESMCGCKGNSLTTQAFTSYKCNLCKKGKSWHNGMPPKWCPDCSKERVVCGYCKRKCRIIGHTPTLGDWLELLGDKPDEMNVWDDGTLTLEIGGQHGIYILTFSLATNEPDNWDTLAELLGLDVSSKGV